MKDQKQMDVLTNTSPSSPLLKRRDILVGASTLIAMDALGETPDTRAKDLSLGQKTETERVNEALVFKFCEAWKSLDNETILGFLDPEIEYHINEGAGVLNGHAAFTKTIGAWLNTIKTTQWDIYRSFTLGEMVVNERVDHFYFKDKETPDWHLKIAGMFIVRDSKIRFWRDYPLYRED